MPNTSDQNQPVVARPVPTPRQIRHHQRAFYGFIHFTINTFTDKEWGYGDESPSVFDPSDFDAGQIAGVAADAHMAGLILTCKHHDGFCLWPTETTPHSVRNSPFRGGNGDVVREVADACRRAGLEFGVYLSPWDRNNALYGSSEYVTDIYRPQLRELLTNYGPLFEVWFDGANGGDGFYGGARETRKIDPKTYYDWPETWRIVRELQPDAVMFSDIGPDVRWVGNEDGIAGDPCWATLRVGEAVPGVADHKQLNRGDRDGETWLIPECDVSIRPGWFWHETENARVRSPQNLVHLYFQSIGRGANFLVNLAPDRRGRVPDGDAASLREMRARLDAIFAHNLADDADVSPAPINGVQTGREVTLTLPTPREVNVVRLREDLQAGQIVDAWALDAWENDAWREIAHAQAIGACRLARFPTVTSSRFRLRITSSSAEQAVLREIALFHETARAEGDEQPAATPQAYLTNATVTQPDDATVVFDFGDLKLSVAGFEYTPNFLGNQLADQYAVSASDDGKTWREVVRGEFSNVRNNPIPQVVFFAPSQKARFLRLQATRFLVGHHIETKRVRLWADD